MIRSHIDATMIRPGHNWFVWLLVVAAWTAGCSMGQTAKSGNPDEGGGGSPAAGASGGGAGGSASGAGGSSSGGSFGGAGNAGVGLDGGVAAGGSGADAGIQVDASSGDRPFIGCRVDIIPVSPQRLLELPVGPMSRLEVQGKIEGTMPPAQPKWSWTVTHVESQKTIPTTMVGSTPVNVSFPLAAEGHYQIVVSVAANCVGQETATATSNAVVTYWLRARALASAGSEMSEQILVEVPARRSVNRDITLTSGTTVAIEPREEAGPAAIPSYVRVSSTESSVTLEGHTKGGPFNVPLNGVMTYDVLVIPDECAGPVPCLRPLVPPLLFRGTPPQIHQYSFRLDQGASIAGRLTSARGAVNGARVLLRAGELPSTVGIADSQGQFALRARDGDFAAIIVPPPGSGLPEARVDAGSGLVIDGTASAQRALDFRWNSITNTTATLAITDSDGAALTRPMHVRLQNAAGTLPLVGTLTVDGTTSIAARGFVHVDATTNGSGVTVIRDLPLASYVATLTSVDDATSITTVTLDLSKASAQETRTLKLAGKGTLAGRLVPAALAAGVTVVAADIDIEQGPPLISAVADAEGRYSLSLNPGRSYRVFVEPLPTRSLARTALGGITATDATTTWSDRMLSPGVAITGVVKDAKSSPASGVLIQAYCVGGPPDCIDINSPNTESLRPVGEALSDGSGSYRLLVPDPGTAN